MFSTETDPVTCGTQLEPDTIQGVVPWVTCWLAGKFETATGPDRPTLPVTPTTFSTKIEPVIRGTQFEPEIIHGVVPWVTD